MRALGSMVVLALSLAVLAAGCRGEQSEPQTGSESHFLVSCSMSCDSGFECLCGVCTERCSSNDSCQAILSSAECVAVDSRPPESACPAEQGVSAFCDVRCETSADCVSLGSEFVCRSGFCRQDALQSQTLDGRIEQSELCDFYVNDVCDAKMQCYGWNYESRDACLAAQECDGWNDFQDMMGRGVVTFDPVATYDCHQRLLADPCALGFMLFVPELPAALHACGALDGLVPEGQPCTGIECVQGTSCKLDAGCPGVCARYENLALGEACLPEICLDDRERCEQCALGLVCSNNVCRPEWQLGDACAAAIDCKPNLWCNRTLGQCQPVAQLGETCSDFEDTAPPCVQDLWCDGPTFGTGVCQPKSDAGGPCDQDGDCVETATCLPTADPLVHVCGAKQPNGAVCDSYADCESDLCDGDVCAPQPVASESCVGECAEGFTCKSSVCVENRAAGQPCDGTTECVYSRCENGLCTLRHHLGEPCSEDDDCLSSDCVAGVCSDTVGCE